MLSRRNLIKRLSAIPLLGGLVSNPVTSALASASQTAAKRDLFKELGVRTFINGRGTITFMTGSLMRDETLAAINSSSQDFCMLDELQDKVGEKIAQMVHAEAAVVTSGAFAALTLGTAGVLTGTDPKKVEQLPHLAYTGMKSEIIIQKAHQIHYNHALLNTGCKLVFVETPEDIEKAINERTAQMHFLNSFAPKGKIKQEEWVALGKKHNIPTSLDMAADVPPVENLWKYNDMGFSFVVVSGGKAIRGPQSAGILMGKKEIIAAARLHMPPRGATIGRGMKVNKEEILGLYVALEKYIHLDHEKEWKMWETQVAHIENAVKNIKGITTTVVVPPLADHTPTLRIAWNKNIVNITTQELEEKLRNRNPSIEVNGTGPTTIEVAPWMMLPGQERIVAARLKEEFSKMLS